MNIKIQSIKFDADQKLLNFIEKKVGKLDKLFDNILEVDVILKIENSQDLDNKVVEIKFKVPGTDLFAQRKSKTFEDAVDTCVSALKVQIKKHKEKIRGV